MSWLCVILRSSDKILLPNPSEQLFRIIEDSIRRFWPSGIQNKKYDSDGLGSISFKLYGRPFGDDFLKSLTTEDIEERAQASRMLLNIVEELKLIDWHFEFSSVFIHKSSELPSCCWFFKQRRNVEKPVPGCAVTLRANDRISLTNGDSNSYRILRRIVENWIQNEIGAQNFAQFKLVGNVWKSNDFDESIRAGSIILNFIDQMAKNRYRLNGAANVRSVGEWLFFEKCSSAISNELMIMFFVSCDRIRLINVPPNSKIASNMEHFIRKAWGKGIQDLQSSRNNVDFKLKGRPWGTTNSEESHASKLFLIQLFQCLLECGWQTIHSFTMQRELKDKACFVLKKCNPISLPHMAIHLRKGDKIQFLNCHHGLDRLISIVRRWPEVQQQGSIGVYNNAGYSLKLKGNPWKGDSTDTVLGCKLLMTILEEMDALGWRLVASLDLNWVYGESGERVSNDNQTWIFVRPAQETSRGSSLRRVVRVVVDLPPSYEEATGWASGSRV